MIRELLQRYGSLTDPQLHLLYLALMALLAVSVAGLTLVTVLRRSTGGVLIRALSVFSIAIGGLALFVAFDGIALAPGGDFDASLTLPFRWLLGFTTASAMLVAVTAAAARTGVIMAAVHGLSGLGFLIYLVLITAVPTGVDPSWELQRFSDFVTFVAVGTLALLAVGFVSSRWQGKLARLTFALVGFAGLVTVVTGLGAHPHPGVSTFALAALPVIGGIVWLWWLRGARPGVEPTTAFGRELRSLGSRLQDHPVVSTAIIAAPLVVALAALLFGGTGSARDVSRIALFGLELTPGLLVPFFFAPALGLLLGRGSGGRAVFGGIALTAVLAALLLAQKEVGNTAVVLATASVVFLVVRGTLPHLLAGGGLAAAGIAFAYHLAPVMSAIPFTFRERIQLWLGGADLVRRGGHLVAANYVTYDLGGFWGIGIHQTPGLNLPRTIVALDTDFPLTILGLYGGMILLSVYVILFVCLSLLLLNTIRRLGFVGDTRRARWQAAVLAGLAAVPIASTTINLAGAITQTTPFTGVPAVFASYGAIFVLGTFLIIAFFILAGNRDALRALIKSKAERDLRSHGRAALSVGERRAVTGDTARAPLETDIVAMGELAGAPSAAASATGAPRRSLLRGLRGRLEISSLRLLARRVRRSWRFQRLDGGLIVLMLGLPAIGFGFGARLAERYTDPTRYYGHPRLTSEILVAPTTEGTTRWAVAEGPPGAYTGPLEEEQRLRLDSLVLRFKQGRLQVRGSCFPQMTLDRGVRIGFAGMLDAPPLPVLDRMLQPLLARFDTSADANDMVLPFGDIAMHHVVVRRTGPDTFVAEPLSPAGRYEVLSADGEAYSPYVAREIRLGEGIRIGVAEPRDLYIDEDPSHGEVCLELHDGALFEYALSPLGPTVLGGMPVLRRHLGRWTVDFEYAEQIKQAAEAGILTMDEGREALRVIPHAPEDRATWDEATRKLFGKVFQIVRIRTEDGGEREALAWTRPFYRDGTRGFATRKELDAFVTDGGRLLGLADSFRFTHVLPTGHAQMDARRHGLIYDRNAQPVTALLPEQRQVVTTLPGAGALIGVSFDRRAIRDGLLRVFAPLLQGPAPLPDVDAELADLLRGEWRGPWGYDVMLTLDSKIHTAAFEVLKDEVAALDEREKDTIHHASVVVLGPKNQILAAAQMPDMPLVRSLDELERLRLAQRQHPMEAPALDAFHRQTTMGSTVKLLTTIAAFRDKEGVLFRDRDEWYIDARGDSAYGVRGKYADRGGVLRSWKGKPLVALHNYGNNSFGRVVSMRDMITHSVNSAASYLGLNVGKERFVALFDDIGLHGSTDLLPPALTDPHGLGYLLDRYYRDAAMAIPLAVAEIPDNERWTLSYTARLPLSGMSDYAILKLAAGASIIARDGEYYPPQLVTAVRSRKTGQVTRFPAPEGQRIIAAEDAETINGYMRDVVRRGTAASLKWRFGLDKDVVAEIAGKTGTGETVKPVKRDAVYDRKNKPATRDNKVFVGFWPASSPDPYVVAVVFEEVSHLDKRIAIRTVGRIIQGIAKGGLDEEEEKKKQPPSPQAESPKSKEPVVALGPESSANVRQGPTAGQRGGTSP